MFTTLRASLMAAAVLPFFASTAHAGIFDFDPAKGGVYVSGFVGGGFPSDASFNGVQDPEAGVPGAAGGPADIDAEIGSDAFYGASIGAKLPFKYWKYFQPRLEVEVSYLENDVEGGSFNGGNQNFSGFQSTLFITLNNYSDIVWKEDQRIIPYFGGGLGAGVVDSGILYAPATAPAPTFGVIGEDTGLATITSLGVTAKVTDKLDLYTEGRYYKIYGVDAERRFIAGGNDGFSAAVDDDPSGFTLTVGTRFNF